ncbi:hypothetical protein KJ590_01550, partial [Patescibacteria group bacterium]|nr:hypothetical protein [Patescibacteria group bacterium]
TINTAAQTNSQGETKDATIGSGQVNVGELDTYIMNNQVSTTTKIFITPEQPVALGVCEQNFDSSSPYQGEDTGGVTRNSGITSPNPSLVKEGRQIIRPQGFRVCLNATSSQIVKFNWWIVGTFADNNSPQPPLNLRGGESAASAGEGALSSPSTTPTSTPTPTVSPSPTPPTSDIPSDATLIPSPSPSPSPSVESPSPSATPTPVSTETPVVTPTPTPTVTPEATVTPTPAPSETPVATPTVSPEATPTPTP